MILSKKMIKCMLVLGWVLSTSFASGQVTDYLSNSMRRGMQLRSAKKLSKSMLNTTLEYGEYFGNRTITHKTIFRNSNDLHDANYVYATTPINVSTARTNCIYKLGPLKVARCELYVGLLEETNNLVRDLVNLNTKYPANHAVAARINVQVLSIQHRVATELSSIRPFKIIDIISP